MNNVINTEKAFILKALIESNQNKASCPLMLSGELKNCTVKKAELNEAFIKANSFLLWKALAKSEQNKKPSAFDMYINRIATSPVKEAFDLKASLTKENKESIYSFNKEIEESFKSERNQESEKARKLILLKREKEENALKLSSIAKAKAFKVEVDESLKCIEKLNTEKQAIKEAKKLAHSIAVKCCERALLHGYLSTSESAIEREESAIREARKENAFMARLERMKEEAESALLYELANKQVFNYWINSNSKKNRLPFSSLKRVYQACDKELKRMARTSQGTKELENFCEMSQIEESERKALKLSRKLLPSAMQALQAYWKVKKEEIDELELKERVLFESDKKKLLSLFLNPSKFAEKNKRNSARVYKDLALKINKGFIYLKKDNRISYEIDLKIFNGKKAKATV